MDMTLIIVGGFSMLFSFAILKYKFEHGKQADAILDAAVFAIMMYLTKGSMTGMVIGALGSTLFSLYLLWSPLNLSMFEESEPKSKNSDALLI